MEQMHVFKTSKIAKLTILRLEIFYSQPGNHPPAQKKRLEIATKESSGKYYL